jgi:RNA polymerase sigma-70 factor (ECF subfamily)
VAILDGLATGGTLARWPQIHVARAALLADAGRTEDAVRAYREALALNPPPAVRNFLSARIAALVGQSADQET